MRISDWSSDVCSSDLLDRRRSGAAGFVPELAVRAHHEVGVTQTQAFPHGEHRARIHGDAAFSIDAAGPIDALRAQRPCRRAGGEIGRAHALTPGTYAHLVCPLTLSKNKMTQST